MYVTKQKQSHRYEKIDQSGDLLWRRKWQPTPAFSPGKSHGQKSLVGYSPWGCQESNRTEHAHTHTNTHTHKGERGGEIGVWD